MFAAFLPSRAARTTRTLPLRASEPREPLYWAIRAEIDYWREYRDIYGEAAAADVVRRVSQALAQARHGDDRIVSRDGDQFMMIIAAQTPEWAMADADRHRDAVESLHIHHQGSPLGVVTISIGLATIVAGASSATVDAIAEAKAALGRAQRSGNQVAAATGLVPA
jgi:diguanylate cyclase (GGDEF)-like protein